MTTKVTKLISFVQSNRTLVNKRNGNKMKIGAVKIQMESADFWKLFFEKLKNF